MKRVISFFLMTVFCPLAAMAQEAEPGGVYFTFDVGQTFRASTDFDLETTEAEDGFESLTALSFGAVTETRSQRLSFNLDTTLNISDGEFSEEGIVARLDYSRNSADARFDISLQSRREDIAFLRDATDFLNDEGEIVLPDDFDDLTGTGIRAETTLSASLSWGETAPVGYNLSTSLETLRYEDASAALIDTNSATFGFGIRLNINEVVTSNITLSYEETDEIGGPTTETTTLSGALTFARPLGDLTTRINLSRDEAEDVFWSASVSRELALPNGNLTGGLGVVEDAGGDPRLTGRIGFSYPRPSGQIDLNAVHSLAPGDDRAATTMSASYTQELSAISNMRIGFDFGQTNDTDGSDVVLTGSLSARYGYSLTEDWQLTVGASANFREDAGVRTDSTSVFVTFERPFSWRP
jgi:hypothetical protein